MFRKSTGKEIQMASIHGKMLRLTDNQSNVQWPCPLAQSILPTAPIQDTHSTCRNKAWHRPMKECRRMMRRHTLSSFEFYSPSLWLFHRHLFTYRSWHRCVDSVQMSSQGPTCNSKENVLAVGPNCLGATESWVGKMDEPSPPTPPPQAEWNRGACTD